MKRLRLLLSLCAALLASSAHAAQYTADVTWDSIGGAGVTAETFCTLNAAPDPAGPPSVTSPDVVGAASFALDANPGDTLRCVLRYKRVGTDEIEIGPLSGEVAASVPFPQLPPAPSPRITIRAGS